MKHELTETEWEIVQAHRRMMKRIERAKARRRMANARALPAQPDKPKRSAAELFSEGRKILSQEAE